MRMTPEKELLDLIEKGCSEGVLLRKQFRQRGLQRCFAFTRSIAAPALAVCLAASLAVFFTSHPATVAQPELRHEASAGNGVPLAGAQASLDPVQKPAGLVQTAHSVVTGGLPRPPVAAARVTRSRAQDLRLAGISWSESPDALIEDVARGVTYFRKKGQMIDGGILVKDIYKDKVLLESNGKSMELQ